MIHPDQEVYRFCPACAGSLTPRQVEGAERPVCLSCGRIHFLDPKVAAGCIVRDESERILLVRRSIAPVDTWTYPGGYVDRGEQPALAAARETLEEAGLEVQAQELLGVFHSPGSIVLVLVYLAQVEKATPQVGPECNDARFFGADELPWDNLSFPSTRRALEQYLAGR